MARYPNDTATRKISRAATVACAAGAWLAATLTNCPGRERPHPRAGFPLPPPQSVGQIVGLGARPTALLLSPDGRTLYVGQSDGRITLWDVASRERRGELRGGHASSSLVNRLALAPDGATLLSANHTHREVILWDLSAGTVRARVSHASTVEDIAVSPDGRHALTASMDAPVKLLELSTGRVLREVRETENKHGYCAVAFLPGGELAVAGSRGGGIVVFSVATGEVRAHLVGAGNERLAVDASGAWLLEEGYLALAAWPLAAVRRVAAVGPDGPPLLAVGMPPRLGPLATAAYLTLPPTSWQPGYLRRPVALDPRAGFPWPVFPAGPDQTWPFDVATILSPDGRLVFCPGQDKVELWDLSRLPFPPTDWRVGNDSETVNDLAVNSGDQWLAAGTVNGNILSWHVPTGAPGIGEVRVPGVTQSPAPDALFYRDGRLCVLTEGLSPSPLSQDREDPLQISIRDVAERRTVAQATVALEPRRGMSVGRQTCISRDGRFILFAFAQPGLRAPPGGGGFQPAPALLLYDNRLRRLLGAGDSFSAHARLGVRRAAFSPSGDAIVTLGTDGRLRVFDTATGRERHSGGTAVPGVGDEDAYAVALTDAGCLLALTPAGALVCWDAPGGPDGERRATAAPAGRALAVSPGGKLAATSGFPARGVWLWTVPELRPSGFFDVGEAPRRLVFLDDDRLAIGSGDGTVRVREVTAALDSGEWNVHVTDEIPTTMALSPDGAQLALGGERGTIRWVDVGTHRELGTVRGAHPGGVADVRFSPDSHRLQTRGKDNAVRWWDLDTGLAPTAPPPGPDPPDPAGLATVGARLEDGKLRWSGAAPDWRPNRPLPEGIQISSVCWLPAHKLLAVAGGGGLWLLTPTEGNWRPVWAYALTSAVRAMAEDPARHEILAAHQDGTVRRWTLPPP